MADRRLGLLVVAGALLAPMLTWMPMLAQKKPTLGLPPYDAALGTDLWMMHVLWLVALTLVAGLLWPTDRWLAAAVAFGGLVVFWRGGLIDPRGAAVFGVGALLLMAVRQTPQTWYARIRLALAASGIVQAAYVSFEMLMQYDPIWAEWNLPWHAPVFPMVLPLAPNIIRPLGTLATVDGAGAWIAITAPLMPVWALPLAAFALWQGFSVGACAAFAAGLLIRYTLALRRVDARLSVALPVIVLAPIFLAVVAFLKGFSTPVITGRVAIWREGLHTAATTDPVFGWGISNWDRVMPAHQLQTRFLPTGEVFRQAHNEYVQWVCEAGLVGLVLLAGWLWVHRGMLLHPTWGGSVAALGVNSMTFFPFHVAALALLGITVIGLALGPSEVTHGIGP